MSARCSYSADLVNQLADLSYSFHMAGFLKAVKANRELLKKPLGRIYSDTGAYVALSNLIFDHFKFHDPEFAYPRFGGAESAGAMAESILLLLDLGSAIENPRRFSAAVAWLAWQLGDDDWRVQKIRAFMLALELEA